MLISNKDIFTNIENIGIDAVINSIDPEQVNEHAVKVILRTIQQSKQILINTLEELISDENKKENSEQING